MSSLWALLDRASRAPRTTTKQVKDAEFALGWLELERFSDVSAPAWKHFGEMLTHNYGALLSLNIGTLDALEMLTDEQLKFIFDYSNLTTAQAFRELVQSELENTGWTAARTSQKTL